MAQSTSNPIRQSRVHHKSNVVDSLKKVIQQQEELITNLSETVNAQDKILNTGYVKIASKKELRSIGLLRQSHFSTNSINYSFVSKELFNPIDIRLKKEIEIPSDTAKVLTPMPLHSYVIEKKKHHSSVLRILDIDNFWGISKYLIIQISD